MFFTTSLYLCLTVQNAPAQSSWFKTDWIILTDASVSILNIRLLIFHLTAVAMAFFKNSNFLLGRINYRRKQTNKGLITFWKIMYSFAIICEQIIIINNL